MIRRIVVALLMLGCAGAAVVRAQNLSSAQLAISSAMQSGAARFSVVPFNFDPNETDLVRARWLTGTGCPSAVTYVPYGGTTPVTYVEPGCPVGDPKDNEHEGLLLVKTGPTDNFVSAGAKLEGVKGTVLTELGYDIRKPGADRTDPRGSHCGAGAPRFDIFVGDSYFFVACAYADVNTAGIGWQRLRFGTAVALMAYGPGCGMVQPCNIRGVTVDRISIVFDEAQDTGTPDNFGAAFLDNIDVNGTMVGRGPGK